MKCSCGKPTSGGAWCATCRRTVDVAIANVATYHDDLDTVRTRQTSYGGLASVGSIGKSQPMPIDATFLPDGRGTRAQAAARNAVTTWARVLLEAIPPLTIPTCAELGCQRCEPIRLERRRRAHPLDTVHSVCSYFARNLSTIAALPWADEFKADILAVERALVKVVDRPPEAWYAGVCGFVAGPHDGSICGCACHVSYAEPLFGVPDCDVPGGCGREYDGSACTQPLYANATQTEITCRVCDTTYDVDERREALLEEARDYNVTVEKIVQIVTTLGDRGEPWQREGETAAKMSARIRQWGKRGRITSHGTRVVDGRPRPVYRVGDVLDLLEADPRPDTQRA